MTDTPPENPFLIFDEYVEKKEIKITNPNLHQTKVESSVKDKVKERFLMFFEQCGLVDEACATIGISPGTAYSWRMEDEQFAEQWDKIRRHKLLPMLEDAMFKRAMERKSDLMLMFLAKSMAPELYDDKLRAAKNESPKMVLQLVDVDGKMLADTGDIVDVPVLEGKNED